MRPSQRRFQVGPPAALVLVVALLGVPLSLPPSALAGSIDAFGRPEQGAFIDRSVRRAEGRTSALLHARPGSSLEAAVGAARTAGAHIGTRYEAIDVFVAYGTAEIFLDIAGSGPVGYIEANRRIRFLTDTSHEATRGEEVLDGRVTLRDGSTIDGSGIGIAIVDTGVDTTHPDFQGRVGRNVEIVCTAPQFVATGQTGFTECLGPKAAVDLPDTDTPSAGGHGTHVAGIAVGTGAASGGRYHGAAPGATLFGVGIGTTTFVENALDGLAWVLENHDQVSPAIRVVNGSWGSGYEKYDPENAVFHKATWKLQEALVAEGITVVFAAGNAGGDGSAPRTHAECVNPTPGVICVANYDDANTGTRDGALATDSSRGLVADPESWPDVSAPGSSIVSTCRVTLPICRDRMVADPPNSYATISGTSMAAPHVSGIVAQIYQVNPDLEPGQVEDILEDTAHKFRSGVPYGLEVDPSNRGSTSSLDKGHGLVDAVAAVERAFEPPAPLPPPTPLPIPIPTPGPIPDVDLNDVSFPSAKQGWAVGEGGGVFTTTDGGRHWVQQLSGTNESLYGVDFVDGSRGWAVGDGGTVISTENAGRTWESAVAGPTTSAESGEVFLRGIDFADPSHGWAVGFSPLETGCCAPLLLSTIDGGQTWAPQPVPAPSGLADVSFLDTAHGFVVGFFDGAFRTEDGGRTWAPMAVSTSPVDSLSAVELTAPESGLIGGSSGGIFATHDGGLTWAAVADFADPVQSLAVSGSVAVAVGDAGLLATSADGGETWSAEASGTKQDLRGVSVTSSERGVAVGTAGFASSFAFASAALPPPSVHVGLFREKCDGLRPSWSRPAFGELLDAVVHDVAGDRRPEIIVGGKRGVRALRPFAPPGRATAWYLPFQTSLMQVELAELDGDPGTEIAVAAAHSKTSRSGILAIAAETGEVLWTSRLAGGAGRMRAGDLDGDGIDEIVALGVRHAGTLYTVSGRDGSMLRPPTPLGSPARDVEFADLTMDGTPDIVVVLENATTLALDGSLGSPLWAHRSDGNVAPPGTVSIETGSVLHAVATGDLNGDAVPDVVVAGHGVPSSVTRKRYPSRVDANLAGGLVAALNGTDGSTIWDYGEADSITYRALSLADLTGDGVPDVVAHGNTLDRGRLLALDGAGRFAGAPIPEPLVLWAFDTTRGTASRQQAPSPDALVLRDADGDGTADAVAALANGTLFAVSGRPPDGLDSAVEEPVGVPLWEAHRATDTTNRHVSILRTKGQTYVLTTDSDHLLSLRDAETGTIAWRLDAGGAPTLAVADLDSDGRAEIGVGNTSGRVYALEGDGGPIRSVDTFFPQKVVGLAAADTDHDGAAELIGASQDGTIRAIDVRRGRALWTARLEPGVRSLAAGSRRVVLGTEDGRVVGLDAEDGRLLWEEPFDSGTPVGAVAYSREARRFAAGDSAGTLRFFSPSGVLRAEAQVGNGSVSDLTAADVDGDGGDEFIAAERRGLTSGSFQVFGPSGQRRWEVDLPEQGIAVATGDLDGDGGEDVIAGAFAHTFGLEGESGDLLWKVDSNGLLGGGIAALDLDGDGREEALVGNALVEESNRLLAVALDGSDPATCKLREPASSIVAADVDGDGALEAVVATLQGSVYLLGPAPTRANRADRH